MMPGAFGYLARGWEAVQDCLKEVVEEFMDVDETGTPAAQIEGSISPVADTAAAMVTQTIGSNALTVHISSELQDRKLEFGLPPSLRSPSLRYVPYASTSLAFPTIDGYWLADDKNTPVTFKEGTVTFEKGAAQTIKITAESAAGEIVTYCLDCARKNEETKTYPLAKEDPTSLILRQ